MMRYFLLPLVLLINLSAGAQALRDLNFKFVYDPAEPVRLEINPVRQATGWTVNYLLTARDTATQASQYSIAWDLRTALSDKEGTPVTQVSNPSLEKFSARGSLSVSLNAAPQILVARVTNQDAKKAWIFFQILDPTYPITGYASVANKPVVSPYLKLNTPVSITGEGLTVMSFYNDDFPAAVPAFSEGMARVSKGLKVDSTIMLTSGEPVTFTKRGLYLIQKDTMVAEGMAFRAEDDYPRLAKVQSLADPLIYVCTRQEFERVKAAKGDKRAFDRVILNITGNTERAKNFMRTYFRRVELANEYFTSYKEGWKTDRGMIYIIFGVPNEVYKFSDREVWSYKNDLYKVSYTFVRSSTVYDPDNFVLIRDKKFQETWYDVIDLWRNARF